MSEEAILSAIRRLEQKLDQLKDEVKENFKLVQIRLDALEEQVAGTTSSKQPTHHSSNLDRHEEGQLTNGRVRREPREEPKEQERVRSTANHNSAIDRTAEGPARIAPTRVEYARNPRFGAGDKYELPPGFTDAETFFQPGSSSNPRDIRASRDLNSSVPIEQQPKTCERR